MTQPFRVSAILALAWKSTNGLKRYLWPALLMAVLVLVALQRGMPHLLSALSIKPSPYWTNFYLGPAIETILIGPLYAGLILTGVRFLRGETISAWTPFSYYRFYLPLTIVAFLTIVINHLGYNFVTATGLTHHLSSRSQSILGTLISIIAAAFVVLALPMAADKRTGIVAAFKNSIRLTKPAIGQLFATYALVCILFLMLFILLVAVYIFTKGSLSIAAIAIMLLGIWVLPYLTMIYAYVYHSLVDNVQF